MIQRALLSGVTGQDGSYLADYYLAEGYDVIGIKRRSSSDNEWRLKSAKKYRQRFKMVEADLTDPTGINNVFAEYQPDIMINCAAMSHVGTSFSNPRSTFEINTVGVLNCLEAIKNISPHTRFVQCGTSEQFGANYDKDKYGNKIQSEKTAFDPQSPYAISKCAAFELVRNYRASYRLHLSNALSFNHGGPRRGENFIEMKIGKWIKDHRAHFNKEISFSSKQWHTTDKTFNKLALGNLDSYRDFTDARDIVRGLAKIAEYDQPDDFVLCSGKTIQMRELVERMFAVVGVKYWEDFVYIDPVLFRPSEVDYLCGDAEKAREVLGWKPVISLDQMIWDIIYS